MSVRLSARPTGANPAASSLAATNRSIGCVNRGSFETGGSFVTTGWNAQNSAAAFQSICRTTVTVPVRGSGAPISIHFTRSLTARSGSTLSGGICGGVPGLPRTNKISGLLSGLPGTIAVRCRHPFPSQLWCRVEARPSASSRRGIRDNVRPTLAAHEPRRNRFPHRPEQQQAQRCRGEQGAGFACDEFRRRGGLGESLTSIICRD